MARFVYQMQNILDIKYKLEEQAKQEYMEVKRRLNDAEEELQHLEMRKEEYMCYYKDLVSEKLCVLDIEECKNAILIMDEYIFSQNRVIQQIERELNIATQKLNTAIQERKIHEKLKENRFEEFLQELNLEEMKEIDQLVSYQYNSRDLEQEA